jgi:hypothetical protein
MTPLALLQSAGAILVPSLVFALASVLLVLAVTWVSRCRARRGAHRKRSATLNRSLSVIAALVAALMVIPVLPGEWVAVARDARQGMRGLVNRPQHAMSRHDPLEMLR